MDDRLPPPIQVIHGSSSGGGNPPKSDDDSIIEGGFKVKNPFFRFFDGIKKFIKNQNIKISIPAFTAIGIVLALTYGAGVGTGYGIGINAALSKFFPDSSPVFHRAISVEGIIQKSSSNKYYLNSEGNIWTLKPVKSVINLADYLNTTVIVKGNLTKEKSVIEVSEIIPLESSLQIPPTALNLPNPSNSSNSSTDLPALYSGLSWVETSKKLLIFTSGKRKIEQEGVYLESAQLNSFPQDFINYYYLEFKNRGFKETLNSINPEGITITYAKDDLFLTFGIKNIYSGSKEEKQLAGYKAFIEHN